MCRKHKTSCNGICNGCPVILPDDMQAQIKTSSRTRRRQNRLILYVKNIRLHPNVWVFSRKDIRVTPMGCRPFAVQQARRREN